MTLASPGIPVQVVAWGSQGSDVTSTATVVGSGADVLASALSFVADGVSSYLVVLLGPGQRNEVIGGGKENIGQVMLDGVAQGIGMYVGSPATNLPLPIAGALVITPTVGVHTVNWRLYCDGGTARLFASGSLSPNSKIIVAVLKLG